MRCRLIVAVLLATTVCIMVANAAPAPEKDAEVNEISNDIDEYASKPCQGEECNNNLQHFTCTCDAGWAGIHCDTDIDECASNPCQHGQCNNNLDSFTCTCDVGWTGIHCSDTEHACPAGWLAGIDKCYKFTDMSKNWSDAKSYCGGLSPITVRGKTRYPSLLMLESDDETRVFRTLYTPPEPIEADSFWLNCNDIQREGTWVCEKDRDGTRITYRNWTSGEPNNAAGEDCAQAYPNAIWNDRGCEFSRVVICHVHAA